MVADDFGRTIDPVSSPVPSWFAGHQRAPIFQPQKNLSVVTLLFYRRPQVRRKTREPGFPVLLAVVGPDKLRLLRPKPLGYVDVKARGEPFTVKGTLDSRQHFELDGECKEGWFVFGKADAFGGESLFGSCNPLGAFNSGD